MMPAGVRVFVCTVPVDLRFGFDRLAQTARERIEQDPLQGGALFVFANRRRTRLKILWTEPGGVCLRRSTARSAESRRELALSETGR